MRNAKYAIITLILLLALLLPLTRVLCAPMTCYGADLFAVLNDDMIKLYEDEIAKEEVVSNQSSAKLERLSEALDVSVNKLKAMLIVQDMSARVGDRVSLSKLATLNDLQLIAFAKEKVDIYGESLTDEQKSDLKSKAKDALAKIGIRI